jgi:hypothetical protein
MNSHILDPIDFLGLDNSDNKSIKTYDVIKQFKTDEKMTIQVGQIPEYTMFFKMLKLGIPKEAVKQKLSLSGLDIRIIDYPETAPYSTVLHYISNPHLGPYVNQNNANTINNNTNTINNTTNNHTSNIEGNIILNRPSIKLDLLKNISGGGFKLKKVDIDANADEKYKQNMKAKILNTVNSHGLKVPTLCDIQGALSKLKKVDFDNGNESNL